MPRGSVYIVLVIGAGVLGVGAAALASRSGALAGFNGGPGAAGLTCTACHGYNAGTGRVDLLGLPRRYRPGVAYDLTVRLHAPDEDGGGFQLSAEGESGFVGAMAITDPVNTTFSDGSLEYVTHTATGVNDSEDTWVANGLMYDYHVGWTAPAEDAGPVTFFTAANALITNAPFSGVRFYWSHVSTHYGTAGDADGDTDVDLADAAAFARCLGVAPAADDECQFCDINGDGTVALADVLGLGEAMDGPASTVPGEFVLADAVRGGRLYDRWWTETGAAAPVGTHPLYPEVGVQTGSTTFRCKECHGWDFKGADGAYGSGSHFTDIAGVRTTALTPRQLFDLLKADPAVVPGGHDLDAYGMTDRDLWDVVKMVLTQTFETDDYIPRRCAGGSNGGAICVVAEDCPGSTCALSPVFSGNALLGEFSYLDTCSSCHGPDGDEINFGTVADPEYVGTVAFENPWEFMHKVRFGHPSSPMPASELLHWPLQRVADVGAYCTTLPR